MHDGEVGIETQLTSDSNNQYL